MKKILIVGGDGFCGWPTSLLLASEGHKVTILDNLSRRKIDHELGTQSLVPISSIEDRITIGRKLVGDLSFEHCDVTDYAKIKAVLDKFKPDCIVHFGEQRSAPYSMIDDEKRKYTVNNNITGTHNLLNAIVETSSEIELVHLGTMGVYGYDTEFGTIPEGYLLVQIPETGAQKKILFPTNPGSVYHMTKSLDQILFQFYSKNWKLKITDLHQGIVWGANTYLTDLHPKLANRFDYDGIYGTVLNRFIVQANNNYPLTIYGTGGQTRAFINISDTAKCISLAISQSPREQNVRIFNQVSEVASVSKLATWVSRIFKSEIKYLENPRNELPRNDLVVDNMGLQSLGFSPIMIQDNLLEDVAYLCRNSSNFKESQVLTSPKW